MNAFSRRGACPALSAPMRTGDGLLVRLNPVTGGLSANALIGLCEAASRHGNGIMEVTARGSLQIRGLTTASARLLAAEVDALGIEVHTGVPIETGPLAGLDPSEIVDPRPVAKTIRVAIEKAGLAQHLGPKVSVIVDGGGRLNLGPANADIRLTAVAAGSRHIWQMTTGNNGSAAAIAGRLNDANAVEAVVLILGKIAEYGREAHARDVPADELCKLVSPLLEAADSSHQPLAPTPGQPIRIFDLATLGSAAGIGLPFGSMPALNIIKFVRKAAILGVTEIRLAPQRALLFLGLNAPHCRQLMEIAATLGFVTDPADLRTKIAACPGAPACASGRIATREIAGEIAARDGDFLDGSFILHVSGCAKGCAHPGVAALTVVGGENGAGLVVNATAKALPESYRPSYDAARGISQIAGLVRSSRQSGETAAACLARLGATQVSQAFGKER